MVRSFSPIKMEFAPARKLRAVHSRVSDFLPALSLTLEAGIKILAVAMVRTKMSGSSVSVWARGVPSTRTSKLMGTLSG